MRIEMRCRVLRGDGRQWSDWHEIDVEQVATWVLEAFTFAGGKATLKCKSSDGLHYQWRTI